MRGRINPNVNGWPIFQAVGFAFVSFRPIGSAWHGKEAVSPPPVNRQKYSRFAHLGNFLPGSEPSGLSPSRTAEDFRRTDQRCLVSISLRQRFGVRSGLRIVLNDSVYRMIERDQHRDIFQMLARETAEEIGRAS